MKALLFLTSLLTCHLLASAQSPNVKYSVLQNIENFKKDVSSQKKTKSRDSLVHNLDFIYEKAKAVDNLADLKAINKYFQSAKKSIDAKDSKAVTASYSLLNNDIKQKLGATSSTESGADALSLFFKSSLVTLNVKISGVSPVSGSYRLYWASFFGTEISELITKNVYDGTSVMLQNPYKMNVRLPGYITFWLKDTTSNKLYAPDSDYFMMTLQDLKMDINFRPLN